MEPALTYLSPRENCTTTTMSSRCGIMASGSTPRMQEEYSTFSKDFITIPPISAPGSGSPLYERSLKTMVDTLWPTECRAKAPCLEWCYPRYPERVQLANKEK